MRTIRITFLWDDFEDENPEEGSSYDKLYEDLSYAGAYDIEEEAATKPEEPPIERKKKKP